MGYGREGLVWLTGAQVCLLAANRESNNYCSLMKGTNRCVVRRDVVSVETSRSRDGLETY